MGGMSGKAMDPSEFCRWLSGYFDMAESVSGWSPSQAARVAFNLDQALTRADPSEKNPAQGCANWLQGYLQTHMEFSGGAVGAPALAKVKAALAELYAGPKPSSPGEERQPRPSAGMVAMC